MRKHILLVTARSVPSPGGVHASVSVLSGMTWIPERPLRPAKNDLWPVTTRPVAHPGECQCIHDKFEMNTVKPTVTRNKRCNKWPVTKTYIILWHTHTCTHARTHTHTTHTQSQIPHDIVSNDSIYSQLHHIVCIG